VYHYYIEEKLYKLDDFYARWKYIISTTSALGLGIDIPDIQVVFYVDIPYSVIEYI
jgi:superfamily II DNA helicase RecQ